MPAGKASLAKWQVVFDVGAKHLLSCDPKGAACTAEADKGTTGVAALQVVSNAGGIEGSSSLDLGLSPSGEVAAMLVDLELTEQASDLSLALFTIRGTLGELALQTQPDGQISVGGTAAAVELSARHAYVVDDTGTFTVIDATNPAKPSALGSMSLR